MAGGTVGKDSTMALQTASTAVDNNSVDVLVVRALPVINWAIANTEKVIKGVGQVFDLYNLYERTNKQAEKQQAEERIKQDKPLIFPDNPDGDEHKNDKEKKFEPYKDGSRRNKDDGSIWEKDKAGERAHGNQSGETQWKRWDNERAYESGKQKPTSVWSDGRVRKWGDQKPR